MLDALESRGILEETVIVLWGDHGYHLGDHTEWNKHSNFEQATRIPFMFSGPGVTAGKMLDTPVNLVDLFPTVFELANVQQSSQTQGKSLVPLIDTDASTNMDAEYAFHQYARGKRMGYSIRTDRYRLTQWFDDNYRSTQDYDPSKILSTELYDYEKDPLETKNWAKDKSYDAIESQLEAKLKQHLIAAEKQSK